MSEQVYLNGRFVPYEKAVIPVEDRGNLFADAVYEVVRFYGGHPLALQAHMERLRRSAEAIRLPDPDVQRLAQTGSELVERNGVSDGTLYIQVSRGTAPRLHTFPANPRPTIFMIARPLPRPASQIREDGVDCISLPDNRWSRCNVKSVALLPNILAKQQAKDAGAFDAIFVRDGVVTEATSANVFAVKDGRIITHPEGPYILPGITRRLVLALAEAEGVPVEHDTLTIDEVYSVDELFLSGTTSEAMPVVSLDGRAVGEGVPGPITRRIAKQYDRMVDKVRAGEPGVPLL